jgi:hypothetical protein
MTLLQRSAWVLAILALPLSARASITCGSRISEHVCTQVRNRLAVIPDAEIHLGMEGAADLGTEGFSIDSSTDSSGRAEITVSSRSARGGNYGAYALLEKLGFRFLHPFAPLLPSPEALRKALAHAGQLESRESPQFDFRGIHLHTQHPIELTNLLTGWGTDAEWRALLPEWERYLEWLVAKRQNHVEWMPLDPKRGWQAQQGYFYSAAYQQRLRYLVARAHAWGLRVGVDIPIAFEQQNAWRLIPSPGKEDDPIENDLIQLRLRLRYMIDAGFDFISTEMGTSEFTAPDEHRMLAWLNEFTRIVVDEHGLEAFTKIHVSTGQHCKDFKDPTTGAPLNFNFLPYFAHPGLQVLPHTVQAYAADDFAPTYGNSDFSGMFNFAALSARSGRGTVWYPESAYWVSADVDVPLFLPVYGLQRVRDLRLIAERRMPVRGQMLFSSGWEHGYWLNDLVAARAAWNPRADLPTDDEAFRSILGEALSDPGNPAAHPALAAWITSLAGVERQQLISGVPGARTLEAQQKFAPGSLTGFAYLMGVETWDEVSFAAARLGNAPGIRTQPERIGLRFKQHWKQLEDVRNLLASMETLFSDLERVLDRADLGILASTRYETELRASMKLLALRTKFIRALYEDRVESARETATVARLWARRAASIYGADPKRIAGWTPNPTAYSFGYLWTARTLFYWWRDLQVAEKPFSRGICFGNIIDPLELAFGKGELHSRFESLQGMIGDLSRCLRIPRNEPKLWQ